MNNSLCFTIQTLQNHIMNFRWQLWKRVVWWVSAPIMLEIHLSMIKPAVPILEVIVTHHIVSDFITKVSVGLEDRFLVECLVENAGFQEVWVVFEGVR